jgi:hypothetical protein
MQGLHAFDELYVDIMPQPLHMQRSRSQTTQCGNFASKVLILGSGDLPRGASVRGYTRLTLCEAQRSAAHAAYAQNYKRYMEVAFELMISVTKSFVR